MERNFDQIPEKLRGMDRWVVFRLTETPGSEKQRKLPYDAKTGIMALVNDAATWSSFDCAAAALAKGGYDGLGFMLGEGVFGVDLDHVLVDGALTQEAQEIVDLMDSYTEVSPSGTGLHIYALGTIPGPVRRRGDYEMYDERRYFTVTGVPFGALRPFAERTEQAAAFYSRFLAREEGAPVMQPVKRASSASALTPAMLIQRAERAENGAKFSALMAGDTAGYDSPSSADLALCNLIAYYADGDRELIDAVFRRSGLMRKKWDEKRGTATYGQRTIAKALRDVAPMEVPVPRPRRRPVAVPVSAPAAAAVPLTFADASTAADCVSQLARAGASDVVPTGLAALDEHLGGGLRPGLCVLGAAPSVGKTTLALQWARSFAASGSDVLYVSYEQTAAALTAKVLSGLSAGTDAPLRTADVTGPAHAAQVAALASRHTAVLSRILFPGADAVTGGERLLEVIDRFALSAQERAGVPVVFVDYLQAMSMPQGSGARYAIDAFVAGLRDVIRRRRVCVVVISSLSRAGYYVPVQLDTLKESGGIEFAGDLVFGLDYAVMHTEAYQRRDPADRPAFIQQEQKRPRRHLSLSCLKNRDGEAHFSVALEFGTEFGVFEEGTRTGG